jgi:epoxide hydrolase
VFNIQRWTETPHGGHFAALEAPELLGADVTTFSHALRGR